MLYSCNTANPAHTNTTGAGKSNDSILPDSDGNRYSVKLLSDKILWMTSNLNLDVPNSYCYDDKKQNCQPYGRLYTWESAMKACSSLGDGWRLPTNDDWHG